MRSSSGPAFGWALLVFAVGCIDVSRCGQLHEVQDCNAFRDCKRSNAHPEISSFKDIPSVVNLTTASGVYPVPLEHVAAAAIAAEEQGEIDPLYAAFESEALILRTPTFVKSYSNCSKHIFPHLEQTACDGRRSGKSLVKRQHIRQGCWKKTVEAWDISALKFVPAAFGAVSDFDRAYPRHVSSSSSSSSSSSPNSSSSSMVGSRRIYLDMGVRDLASSALPLAKIYEDLMGSKFDAIHLWEAKQELADQIRYDAAAANFSMHLHEAYAWYNNNGLHWRNSRRETSDVAQWLLDETKDDDFVVLKMDIEMAEFKVMPDMCRRGALSRVDELFIEVHYNEPEIHNCNTFNKCTKRNAMKLVGWLRHAGVAAHFWV